MIFSDVGSEEGNASAGLGNANSSKGVQIVIVRRLADITSLT